MIKLSMESGIKLKLVRILEGADEVVDVSQGIHWIAAVDDVSFNVLEKFDSFASGIEKDVKLYVLVFEMYEGVKEKVGKLEARTYLATSEMKELLNIASMPWFVCIENNEFVYSSSDLPSNDKVKANEDDLTEMKSPEKINPDINILSISPELPNISTLVSKDLDNELNRAEKKINKLRLRVSQQEQTIEDYKSEINMLKSLLAEKKSKNIEKFPKPNLGDKFESKLNEKQNNFTEDKDEEEPEVRRKSLQRYPITKNKSVLQKSRVVSQIDDSEFWKIEENDQFQESIKLDDRSIAKDLWLMGLINSSPKIAKANDYNEIGFAMEKNYGNVNKLGIEKASRYGNASKQSKPPTLLPPLQMEGKKNSKSLHRESQEIKRNGRTNSKNQILSKSKLAKV